MENVKKTVLFSVVAENEKNTSYCGGFATENFVVCVKHVFDVSSYEKTYVSNYEQWNECSYYHINVPAYVHSRGETLAFDRFFSSEASDVAVIPVSSYYRQVNVSSFFNGKSNVFLYDVTTEKFVKTTKIYDFSSYDSEMRKIAYYAKKGSSGYPVVDSSGYVNGIICAVDNMNKHTYVIDGNEINRMIYECKKYMKDLEKNTLIP